MKNIKILLTILMASTTLISCTSSQKKIADLPAAEKTSVKQTTSGKNIFIQNIRQMTFEGKRAGEGYFTPDGELMIFQSERESNNPFYQMYIRNFAKNSVERVSPGYGKTTCGWISSDKRWIIFSSTHLDPEARAKQQTEIDFRNSGKKRRYSWDYDEHYDLFRASIDGKNLINLTRAKGYDAEGAISPNGRQIVFASNRHAYSSKLNDKPDEENKAHLERDPSYFMDIYIMNSDGSHVKRLTQAPGYDGGPFFSPDGKRIVWRRFSSNGMKAEVYTMNTDGTDEKQITHMDVMSWAPFYHPSGDYIIFTSSLLGHQNFELFAVDVNGKEKPVRITYLDGFDGLPVFTPDGNTITWNKKLSETESQIMIADWNDFLIRKELHLPPQPPTAKLMSPDISEKDLKTTMHFLASKELAGRATGSTGEEMATHAIEKYFKDIGLSPYNGKDYVQNFPFLKEALLGPDNNLTVTSKAEHKSSLVDMQLNAQLNKQWRPVAFSRTGEVTAAPIVFAGYGIRAPKDGQMDDYDSYKGLDIKDKWVMVFRYTPEKVPAARRLYLQSYSRLEHKAILARDLGARGIIFVSGPSANALSDLVPFRRITGSDLGIAALTISDELAKQLLDPSDKNLKTLQSELDQEKTISGFELNNIKLSTKIEINMLPGEGHNTLGLLRVPGAKHTLIIGAHGDHLGDSATENSLRTSNDKDPIHYGADDNASGVSAILELAHYFKNLSSLKNSNLKQNVLFAVWSGEELGTLGSQYFVKSLKNVSASPNISSNISPSAYINMDMIGRWKNNPQTNTLEPLLIQSVGTSAKWREYIEALRLNFSILLQNDPYLPTDSMVFLIAKIPSINFFTGVHTDYHSPRDTEDKINFAGLKIVTQTIAGLAKLIVTSDKALPFNETPRTTKDSINNRRGFRIFLGTIPDYSQEKIKGVRLSGVIAGGPAEKAGLRNGDVIIEFSNKQIDTIYDYVYTLETIRPNEVTTIVVLRDGRRSELNITPQAKE